MTYAIETIHSSPLDSEFTPLQEHQSFTPASFSLEENPVLYFKCIASKIEVSNELPQIPNITLLKGDIYVSSSNLTFWFPDHSIGLVIPYQRLTLHAIQSGGKSVYLQIESEGLVGNASSEDSPIAEFTVSLEESQSDTIQEFYNALSECSSLHPDASEDGEDDVVGFDGMAEDDEGWITAESLVTGQGDDDVTVTASKVNEHGPSAALEVNVGEPGDSVRAGQRRNREEEDGVESAAQGEADEETKWRRTD